MGLHRDEAYEGREKITCQLEGRQEEIAGDRAINRSGGSVVWVGGVELRKYNGNTGGAQNRGLVPHRCR